MSFADLYARLYASGGTEMYPSKTFNHSEAKIKKEAEDLVPDHMIDGLVRYVMDGIQPGEFLFSVLSNDFIGAASQADIENYPVLRGWAILVHNTLPAGCSGSREIVFDWITQGGVNGLVKSVQEQADAASRAFNETDIKEPKNEV